MAEYRSSYEAIVFGPLRLIQLLCPSLVNTAAHLDRGRTVIFNIGTAGRHILIAWTGGYIPAKVYPSMLSYAF